MIELTPGREHVAQVTWIFACDGDECAEAEVCDEGSYPEGWAFFLDGSTLCRECACRSVALR